MTRKPNFTEAITETIFVLLPFIVLFVIKLMQADIKGLIFSSDFSLAISIMYGQLLAKTLTVPDSSKNTDAFRLFQVIVFCISIITIVMYAGFQLIHQIPTYIYYIQIFIFIAGFVMYIPIYTLIRDVSKIERTER